MGTPNTLFDANHRTHGIEELYGSRVVTVVADPNLLAIVASVSSVCCCRLI